ncbi:hypothetical protein [Streptomyces sp. RFCAC02]|uniref:hypothetical protein n=1 Tax=Streptomyces sp. RFCAC02 TaxID=2499143 RepID=UPI0010227358|nr:hypothetical protein [Streptomyces sp. RFCAC02]
MRTAIRLALPLVAAAAALSLTACGDEDASSDGGSGETAADEGGTDADTDAESQDSGQDGEGGSGDGAEAGTDGSAAPSVDDLMGNWFVDPADPGRSHRIVVEGPDEVSFIESLEAEGDLCNRGVYADGTLTFAPEDCLQQGAEPWPDRSATLVLNEDGTLHVTWESGLEEDYTFSESEWGTVA